MRVVLKINSNEGYNKFICLDENEVVLKEGNENILIESKYEDRINSLISLFVLKNEWENLDVSVPAYEIIFENGENREIYKFDTVPSNFSLFMGYIIRIVGGSLWVMGH